MGVFFFKGHHFFKCLKSIYFVESLKSQRDHFKNIYGSTTLMLLLLTDLVCYCLVVLLELEEVLLSSVHLQQEDAHGVQGRG